MKRIGIPLEGDNDEHIIKPSTINTFVNSMEASIKALELPERLRYTLREAVMNGFLNTERLIYKEEFCEMSPEHNGIAIFLPDSIGELRHTVARIAGYIKEAGFKYKLDLPENHPDKDKPAPTNLYLSKMNKALFTAFNQALASEGLEPISSRQRA